MKRHQKCKASNKALIKHFLLLLLTIVLISSQMTIRVQADSILSGYFETYESYSQGFEGIPFIKNGFEYSILYPDGTVHENDGQEAYVPYIRIAKYHDNVTKHEMDSTHLYVMGYLYTDKYFQVKTADGSEFSLLSFKFENLAGRTQYTSHSYKVIGYKDGFPVPGATYVFSAPNQTKLLIDLYTIKEFFNIDAFTISGMYNEIDVNDLFFCFDDLETYHALSAPTPDIPGGTYNSRQEVTLTPHPNAVSTYYTLNGNDPSNGYGSTAYTDGTIGIDGEHGKTIVLKAVSYLPNGMKGPVLTASYTFDKQGPTGPTASVPSGYYNREISVTLRPEADAARTYYTLNGTEPDESSTLYSGETFEFDGAHGEVFRLYAVSYDAYGNKGYTQYHVYTFDKVSPEAPTPRITPGTYNSAQTITFDYASDSQVIYYTLDGSEPDRSKPVYSRFNPIIIDGAHGETVVLKAVSYDYAGNRGEVLTATYTLDKKGPVAPIPGVDAGSYNCAQNVTLTPAADAVSTYYTTDGSEPDNTKTAYTAGSPISVDGVHGQTVVLKAVSYDALGNKGDVLSASYTFDTEGPAAPTADIASGTYNSARSVDLIPPPDAESTYYTTDGSEPDNIKKQLMQAILSASTERMDKQ